MDRETIGTSGLEPALVDAYRPADYHVTGCEPAFVLHVDERSPALAALYAATGSACSAWLTACNPASVLWTDEANDVAQRSLKLRLARGGIRGIDGFGADPHGRWPAEPGVLALGLDQALAGELARDLGQNALLWVAADTIPRLLLLR